MSDISVSRMVEEHSSVCVRTRFALSTVLCVTFVLLLVNSFNVRAANGNAVLTDQDPSQLIESVARMLLTRIDAHRDDYRRDSGKLEKLMSDVLLPHLDCSYASRLVLARHWAKANLEQRKLFTPAFCRSLLRTYGGVLLDFKLARLQVLPYQGASSEKRATVRTIVRQNNGARVHLNYSMHRTPRGWEAYDVKVEGISYLASFRADFDTQVRERGLDALIARLERGS